MAPTSNGDFAGWLAFIYQDGHNGIIFHYTAMEHDGSFVLRTDSGNGLYPSTASSSEYPFGQPTEESHVGDTPIPAGMTAAGTVLSTSSLTLSNCASYLYWVKQDPSLESCTFTDTP